MPNRRSTIEFTDITEPLLKELELSGFDIRGIVNGAIIIFSKLTGDEQKNAIAEAGGIEHKSPSPVQIVRNKLKDITKIEQEIPGTIIKVLSEKDSIIASDLRKALGPDIIIHKKKSLG